MGSVTERPRSIRGDTIFDSRLFEKSLSVGICCRSNMTSPPSTINYTDHTQSSSFYSAKYTSSYNKYSCIEEFYYIHVTCCWVTFLSGVFCVLARLIRQIKWLHAWFGRLYILAMLFSTASSLLINNEGLPLAVLVNFAYCMSFLAIGWFIVIIYRQNMDRIATDIAMQRISSNLTKGATDSTRIINAIKGELADSRSFSQRMFSLKTLHGLLMTVSWVNIAGRIPFSNPGGLKFACYTYPAYKPIAWKNQDYRNESLTLVEVNDPNYDNLPWSGGPALWASIINIGSLSGFILIASIWSYVASR